METKNYIGTQVMTTKGAGTIIRHKPGNHKNQDFLVQLGTGKTHWFALNQIQFIDK